MKVKKKKKKNTTRIPHTNKKKHITNKSMQNNIVDIKIILNN